MEVSRNNVRYRSLRATEADWFRTIYPLPYDEETWQAVGYLFQRSWFERRPNAARVERAAPENSILVSSSETLSSTDLGNDADLFWLLNLVQGRKFVDTEEGYMGLGPSGALSGE
jgi:hypothetical protein